MIPLSHADERCGAKAANLARLLREGFAVPAGFVIEDVSDDSWVHELESALRGLGSGPFAVRSSAVGEDAVQASFAGQLHTTLGATTTAQVAVAVRRTAMSGTSPQAAAYTARTSRLPGPVVSVIVQRLVRAEVAGVLFTRQPVTGADQVVIEAARGLGDKVVNGSLTPQRWTIDGDVLTTPDTIVETVLTAAQVRALGETGRRIEASLGCPQDVEWAIADGTVWVLQARPITTVAVPDGHAARDAGEALVTGTPASPGTATGLVRMIGGLDDFIRFRSGDVLVCRTTSPAWTPLLARAAAVVTEVGGVLSHAAIVAREFGIPAVTAADDAMTVLADRLCVVVDGSRGNVALAGQARHRDHTTERR
ncbi:PEP/pyruvate-binding domain-containing protein [Streptomyces sp. NPDC002012]|uniref:PEP/pyruvate-binding domain-containing protein n=1 Tax=Streptomyces sp. NPDC002012 TaxID=3154532 RepID=UPI00331E6F8A